MSQFPPLRIPIDSPTFSPLVIEVIKLLPKFHLYPSLLHLELIELESGRTVEFRIRPMSWRLLPWLFNVTVLIGLIGFGSCAFVAYGPTLMETRYRIPISRRIVMLCFTMFPPLHTGICLLFLWRREFADIFNEFVALELECKI